jgi:hypothetical protein
MSSLKSLLQSDANGYAAFSDHLNSLSPDARVDEIRSLSGGEQASLYDRVAKAAPIGLEHFVPKGSGHLKEVIHHGKNSLLAFTHFQKRFCVDQEKNLILGYNEQTMRWFTGPGYFVVRPVPEDSRVVIDYTQVPDRHPSEWPDIHPNSRLFSRFVYYNMQDFMWKVSEHVSIGRAFRGGKPQPNYFVLCREDG